MDLVEVSLDLVRSDRDGPHHLWALGPTFANRLGVMAGRTVAHVWQLPNGSHKFKLDLSFRRMETTVSVGGESDRAAGIFIHQIEPRFVVAHIRHDTETDGQCTVWCLRTGDRGIT